MLNGKIIGKKDVYGLFAKNGGGSSRRCAVSGRKERCRKLFCSHRNTFLQQVGKLFRKQSIIRKEILDYLILCGGIGTPPLIT